MVLDRETFDIRLWTNGKVSTLSARIVYRRCRIHRHCHLWGTFVGNLDFTDHAGFSWYCILLLVSGAALVVLGPARGLNKATRVLNLVFGLGFLGYGIYLTFFFGGGSYVIFFKAFIAPVVLIVNSIREMRAAGLRRAAKPQAMPPFA